MRDIPPLEAKVHETVAFALAGNSVREALAVAEADAEAVADADAVADDDAEPVAVAVGLDVEVAAAAHPARPTIAAVESPLRKALRVTAE
ncbi:hypothetical protein [Tessaracoccus lacteus]|uniref:Uncharacterized protein n=1 Tax=Tessaracoccus lacteus TaxID=3041766 RepID=A0ABY8Q149_9ACTN|nr:hypothetical protein [Tessaracoccus sp. T21]WGT48470.1 hypothetical protein QH948_06945 [Tessaracoccus sp. T21]